MLTVRLDTEVQIRREQLTRLALGVLREESSHGYELMKQLEEEFGFHPGEISAGTLYRTLRLLEREGLCNSEWEVPSEGDSSACRIYSVTDAGEDYLRVLVDDSIWGRNYGSMSEREE
jgi:PadR family transcriptional regulator, regulatory protein PadR